MAAGVGRWTHAVKHERVSPVAVWLDIEIVMRRIDALVRCTSPVELCKQTVEPVRMLVIDRNWTLQCCHGVLNNEC